MTPSLKTQEQILKDAHQLAVDSEKNGVSQYPVLVAAAFIGARLERLTEAVITLAATVQNGGAAKSGG